MWVQLNGIYASPKHPSAPPSRIPLQPQAMDTLQRGAAGLGSSNLKDNSAVGHAVFLPRLKVDRSFGKVFAVILEGKGVAMLSIKERKPGAPHSPLTFGGCSECLHHRKEPTFWTLS